MQDIANLEQTNRTHYASGSQAVLYYVFLNGGSDQDTTTDEVLGGIYTGTSIAVFKDTLRASGSDLVTADAVEASMLVHEAGHAIGLVRLGAPLTSNHEDVAHPNHCTVQTCVMFWEVETTSKALLGRNGGKRPDDFDPLCVADLRANGGQ